MHVLLTDGTVDVHTGEVSRAGSHHRLTVIERELLAYLATRPGRAVSREELHQRVWGYSATVATRAADLAVLRLRRKIEQVPSSPRHLVTEPSGYSWRAATPGGGQAPTGNVALVVALRAGATDERWLALCAEAAGDGYLVELAPDRAVVAFGDPASAAAFGRALGAAARVGLAWGPARAMSDPRGGRTLYGGEVLALASGLAHLADDGQVLATEGDGPNVGPLPVLPDRAVDVVQLAGTGPPRRPPPVRRTNLHARLDPWVDRPSERRELAERAALPGVVGLVGPPGIGKTRLAEVVALGEARAGGVWQADASGCGSAADVARSLLRAMGAARTGSDDEVTERLLDATAARGPSLLLVDGAERIEPELREVLPAWVAATPEATWLVTTRIWRGPGALTLGPMTVDQGLALLRARSGTRAEAATVEALEGIPLALELVAKRLRLLGPRGWAAIPTLDLLADAGRTMRGAIRASWELLDRWERETLVRASVFARPFALDDAASVLALPDPEAPWAVDLVAGLCDHHLLRTVEARPGLPRIEVPALIRAFAREQPLPADAAQRHAERFALRARELPWVGPSGVDEDLVPDALLAAGRAADRDVAGQCAALALAGAVTLPHVEEALVRSATLLEAELDPVIRAHLHLLRGRAFHRLGRADEADVEVSAASAFGEPLELVGACATLAAVLARVRGELAQCTAHLDRAEELFGRAGCAEGLAFVRLHRAVGLQEVGEPGRAAGLARSVASDRSARVWHGHAAAILGTTLRQLGSLAEAAEQHERAIAAYEHQGDPMLAANQVAELGSVQALLGHAELAATSFRRASETLATLGAIALVFATALKRASHGLSADRPQEAVDALDEAADWVDRLGDQRLIGAYWALRCEERGVAGDRDGVERAEREALRLLDDDRVGRAHVEVHRGMARLALGDVESAGRSSLAAERMLRVLELGPASDLYQEVRRLRRAIHGAAPHGRG